MYNLIRADLFKLRKSLAMKVLLAIAAASSLIMAVIAYLVAQGSLDTGTTGIGFLFSDANMLAILGSVTAGLFICGDFENKTIHHAIACGSGRGRIILSKAITFFCALLALLLPYALVTIIALSTGAAFDMGSNALGFLHIMTGEAGIAFSGKVIAKLLVIMLTMTLVYWAQLSICVPLALVLKKPVLIVAIYYVFIMLSTQLNSLSGSLELFDRVYGSTPYDWHYTYMLLNTGTEDIWKAIIVSTLFIIVMLAIAFNRTRKNSTGLGLAIVKNLTEQMGGRDSYCTR